MTAQICVQFLVVSGPVPPRLTCSSAPTIGSTIGLSDEQVQLDPNSSVYI